VNAVTDPDSLADGSHVLFVDESNSNCDNSYSRTQALSPETPWCGLQPGKLLGGDLVYVLPGEYVTSDKSYDFYGMKFSSPVLISGYPNLEKPVFGNYKEEYLKPNNLWKDKGDGIWSTDTYVYGDAFCTIAYKETGKLLMSYDNMDSVRNSGADYPVGFYATNDDNTITARFDEGMNPNNIGLYIACAPYRLFKIQEASGITFKDIKVQYSTIPFNIKNSENIVLDGVDVISAVRNSVFIQGTASKNIVIKNSVLDKKQPDNWPWKTVKTNARREETSAIDIENTGGHITIQDNQINNYFNGIMYNTGSLDANPGVIVINNKITNIYDDAIELEKYCRDSVFSHNIINNAFVGVSISPTISNNCEINYNLIDATNHILAYENKFWTGEGFKIMGEQSEVDQNLGFHSTNLKIHDNTIVGKGISSTTDRTNTQSGNVWLNNMFYSGSDMAIYKSGDSDDNNMYDYNCYYSDSALFQYWQDDTDSSVYDNLNDAKQMSGNPGGWDTHSLNKDPLIGPDYLPYQNSPLIDSGIDNNVQTDVLGNPIYGAPDIGAFEYQPPYNVLDGLNTGLIRLYSDGKYRLIEHNGPLVNMKIEPVEGFMQYNADEKRDFWMDINISEWEDVKRFSIITEKSSRVRITLWGLRHNIGYELVSDGNSIHSVSDADGRLEFVLDVNSQTFELIESSDQINHYCGDSNCDSTEDCGSCETDCGACELCGNGICDTTEDCDSCETDCGACELCGNGICDITEDCNSCENDCGACELCGNGICDITEDCGSCESDCGACELCGNGICDTTEDCGSCESDCGECVAVYSWLEAEYPAYIEEPFVCELKSPGYLWITEGTGDKMLSDGAIVYYNLNISVPGDYYIWGRVIAPDGNSDSFFVNLDGALHLWDIEHGNAWHWDLVNDRYGDDPVVFELKKGTYELMLVQREDGTKIDKLLITNDMGYIPTSEGSLGSNTPVDSCGDSICDSTEDCSSCESDCGVCEFCGDSICQSGEDCSSCESDCGSCVTCGDSICQAEEFNTCASDCGIYTYIEAETANVHKQFIINEDSLASGREYISLPDSETSKWEPSVVSAKLDFEINVSGTYYIWGRAIADDLHSNSFFVSIDDSTPLIWDVENFKEWGWDMVNGRNTADPLVFKLDSGKHTIDFIAREKNTLLDTILITNDANFDPETEFDIEKQTDDLVVEAQDAISVNAPMEIVHDNISFLYAPNDVGNRWDVSDSKATYEFYIKKEGDYTMKGRVIAPGDDSDSFFMKIDSNTVLWHVSQNNDWHWDDVHESGHDAYVFHLTEGMHKLEIIQRESGTKIDKVVISITGETPGFCGNNVCDLSETCSSCPGDCGACSRYDIDISSPELIVEPMIIKDDILGTYLTVPKENPNLWEPTHVEAVYSVYVSSPGEYVLMGKVLDDGSLSDSFYVEIDNTGNNIWDIKHSLFWTWDEVNSRYGRDPFVFFLGEGKHDIHIRQRESGTKLKELVLLKEGTSL